MSTLKLRSSEENHSRAALPTTLRESTMFGPVVTGSLLAHVGRHTPVLLAENKRVPPVVGGSPGLLNRPRPAHPRVPLMHRFISGTMRDTSRTAPVEPEKHLIFPDPAWTGESDAPSPHMSP